MILAESSKFYPSITGVIQSIARLIQSITGVIESIASVIQSITGVIESIASVIQSGRTVDGNHDIQLRVKKFQVHWVPCLFPGGKGAGAWS
jgi:methyl-accepting chemotaxis protein